MKKDFEDFWKDYLRMHSRPETRRMHAIATASAIALVGAGIVLRRPSLVLMAPLVDYAIAQSSHRKYEKNVTRPWRDPLRHARAELRLFRLTIRHELRRKRRC